MTKKLQVYFSDGAWRSLQNLMGKNGSPSPTINALLESVSSHDIRPVVARTTVSIPFVLDRVSAGFPSPANDYIDRSIDLNEFLIDNQSATFIVEVNSLSMLNAGIDVGDQLIVDRSLNAHDGEIVIALVDNEFTVKRLIITPQETYLKAENPEYSDIHFLDGQELQIWGVVTSIIKPLRKRK